MSKIVKTSIIIYDDYNNILAVQKGKNKDNPREMWSLVGKELKGKESEEKAIIKAVEKELGCGILNLAPVGEYAINGENNEKILVYSGVVGGQIVCHKTINKMKWINEREVETCGFSMTEKEALMDFFKNHVK